MRVESYQREDGEWVTHVYVSRRNLVTLLAKLGDHPKGSFCTIVAPASEPATLITAENDDVHYAHPSRTIASLGRMHSDIEKAIRVREFIQRTAKRDFG